MIGMEFDVNGSKVAGESGHRGRELRRRVIGQAIWEASTGAYRREMGLRLDFLNGRDFLSKIAKGN